MKVEVLGDNYSLGSFSEELALHEEAPTFPGVCVSVGDIIEDYEENTLRGHGTRVKQDQLLATVCGIVNRVNKLITVRTLHRRYAAEVGDIVLGRVTEIGGKRWKVDLQAKQEAHLMLSAVSLPGGIQRRRTAEDELQMREIFKEGDIVSAEVQAVHQDGLVLLHTRSSRYGLLENGQIVQVPSCLVKQQRQHMASLDNGIGIILGCNGLIWVGLQESNDINHEEDDIFTSIARICQSIKALNRLKMMISLESISNVTSLSSRHGFPPKNMRSKDFLRVIQAESCL